MRITEAAQQVQRSGFPEAYEDHAADARTLASALTGQSQDGKFNCVVRHAADDEPDTLDRAGLTVRAAGVRQDLEAAFGDLSLGGFAPGGVTDGHMEGSAHYEGRALDVFVRPIGKENRKKGWAMAYYLVAQAERLGIDHVIFDAQDLVRRPPLRGRLARLLPRQHRAARPTRPSPSSSTATTSTSTSSTDQVRLLVRRGVTSCAPKCVFLRQPTVRRSCRAEVCLLARKVPQMSHTSARKNRTLRHAISRHLGAQEHALRRAKK